jgi:hypothetical protein
MRTGSGAHSSPYPVGGGSLFLGVGADRSLPPSAEVKNAWSFSSTPSYVFITRCLIKHRGNYTFPAQIAKFVSRKMSLFLCSHTVLSILFSKSDIHLGKNHAIKMDV